MHTLATPSLDRANPAWRDLHPLFGERLHRPGDAGYDAARLPWRRTIDPRPALVAEASSAADIRAALLTARMHHLPLGVQGTGHGLVRPANDGLLLATGRMNAVRVDPARQVAITGPGARWQAVIDAATPYGLAPLSGSSSGVGVSGYTLGGGTGWLSRRFGYAADHLLRATVVTADGDCVIASASSHPDLWWALRGGGGNFGIVTELEFRLFPVQEAVAGMSFHPIDRAAALLAAYRDWAPDEPDDLQTAVILMRMSDAPMVPEPVRGQPVAMVRAFSLGTVAQTDAWLAPLLAAAGPPLHRHVKAAAYAGAATALTGPPPPPTAMRQQFDLVRDLPDGLVDTLAGEFASGSPSPLRGVEIRHWGGAMSRPAPDAGPVGHRNVPFSVAAAAVPGDAPDPAAVHAAMDAFTAKLRPHATGGSFLNFLDDPARAATAWTEADYRRLAAIKAVYDPDNVFRHHHAIAPAHTHTPGTRRP